MPVRLRLLGIVVFAGLGLSLVGCGPSGPTTYHVSGTVKVKGVPLENGRIYFEPNLAKKNDGTVGFAEIRGGSYDTSVRGKGMVGGAIVVRIEGFDAQTMANSSDEKPATLLVDYREEIELPKETTKKDFDVPPAGAKTEPKAGGKQQPGFVPE